MDLVGEVVKHEKPSEFGCGQKFLPMLFPMTTKWQSY